MTIPFNLAGRVAVIVGASAGIGAAIARLFASRGAAVVLVARRENLLNQLEVELNSHDYAALAVPGDVTDPECPAKVFSAALEAFGRVDILVNNAGISDHHRAASRTPDELWERVVAVNQTAPFRFAREALRHMTAQGSGNIINISSIGGVYSIAGAGVFGFEDRAYRPDQEHCRAVCRYWDSLQRRLPRADRYRYACRVGAFRRRDACYHRTADGYDHRHVGGHRYG